MKILHVSLLKTFFYNFLSRHIERVNGGKILILKKQHFIFGKNSKIIVDGGIVIFGETSYLPSVFRLESNSLMIMQKGSQISYGADFLLNQNSILKIGSNTKIGCHCFLRCGKHIEIGDNCLFAHQAILRDTDGHFVSNQASKPSGIVIANNVWVCANSMILKNVKIGNNSVIGASSLVIKDIPSNTLAAGHPAVVKKTNIYWIR